jgi:hypothetical protein
MVCSLSSLIKNLWQRDVYIPIPLPSIPLPKSFYRETGAGIVFYSNKLNFAFIPPTYDARAIFAMSIETENFLPEASLSALSLQKMAREVNLEKLAPKEEEIGEKSEVEKLAVVTQFAAAVNPNASMQQNYLNAISFLQAQDAGLAQATQIFARMSELKALSETVDDDSEEMARYEAEFQSLLRDINTLRESNFNGLPIFGESIDENQSSTNQTEEAIAAEKLGTEKEESTESDQDKGYTATIIITEATEGDKITASVNGQAIDAVTIQTNANETAQDLADSINSSSAGVVATAAAGVVKVESDDQFSLEAKAIDAEGISNGTVTVQGPEPSSEPSEDEKSKDKKLKFPEEPRGKFESEKESPAFRLVGSNENTHKGSFSHSGFSTIVHWTK